MQCAGEQVCLLQAPAPPLLLCSPPHCPPPLPSSLLPSPSPRVQCVGEQVCLLEALAPMACEVQGATSRLTALITAISGLGSEEPQVGPGRGGSMGQSCGCLGGWGWGVEVRQVVVVVGGGQGGEVQVYDGGAGVLGFGVGGQRSGRCVRGLGWGRCAGVYGWGSCLWGGGK